MTKRDAVMRWADDQWICVPDPAVLPEYPEPFVFEIKPNTIMAMPGKVYPARRVILGSEDG